jgi:hypothetical protein
MAVQWHMCFAGGERDEACAACGVPGALVDAAPPLALLEGLAGRERWAGEGGCALLVECVCSCKRWAVAHMLCMIVPVALHCCLVCLPRAGRYPKPLRSQCSSLPLQSLCCAAQASQLRCWEGRSVGMYAADKRLRWGWRGP